MRRFGRGLAGAVVGLIGGGALAALVASGACWLFAISQAEGAYAMQVAFFWVPLGAIVGLIVGIILALRR